MIILEKKDYTTGQHEYGMSTADGDKVTDLPTAGVPQGSSAMDYTTSNVYFFDGVSWK